MTRITFLIEYLIAFAIAVSLGVLSQVLEQDSAFVARIVGLLGLVLLMWPCVRHMERLHRTPYWGILGAIPLFAIIMLFLPAKSAELKAEAHP